MSDDLLTLATRASRDATAPSSRPDADTDVAAATLARIERSLGAARTPRASRVTLRRWIAMPLAASFLVLAAWASASGRLPAWLALRTHEDPERTLAPVDPPPPPPTSPRAAASPPPEPASEPEPEPTRPY